jgi:nicotinamide mononucleotide adenylyltransferase
MEENQIPHLLMDAIRHEAPGTVEQMLGQLSARDLTLSNWNDLIEPALKRIRCTQSMLEHQASRKVLFSVIRHTGQWIQETGQSLEDTILGELFIQKVDQNDLETVQVLLEAGADPNQNVTNDNFVSPLQSAAFNQRPDMVRLLLHFGADPTILQEDAESVFRALTRIGRMEIAWICLFHEAIGTAPKPLVQAFKIGAPDGSMENAIAEAKLSEQEARNIFKALLTHGQGRSAAAVICGYCTSLNQTSNSEEGTQIMLGFITLDLRIPGSAILGSLIHPLRLAGFAVEELSYCKQDRALCDAIRNGSADLAMDLLCRLDVCPLVCPDDNYLGNYTCEALTLALERDLIDVILCLFECASLPLSCRLEALEWMIRNDHTDYIPAILGDIGSYAQYRDRLLELAVEQNKPLCLATLIGGGVSPEIMHGRALFRENCGTSSLLARSIPVIQQDRQGDDESSSEVAFEDYYCTYVLLLSLEETWDHLPDLSDKILLARAQMNDLEAIFFLCSTGYVPVSVFKACAEELKNPETESSRITEIENILTTACDGLIYFLTTVQRWNVRDLSIEALECIIPEFSLAGRVKTVKDLVKALNENKTLADQVYTEPVERLLEIKALLESRDLDNRAISDLLQVMDEALCASHAIPSLQEITRDKALESLTPELFGQFRGILTTIHPEFIWEELLDRMDSLYLSVQQLVIMEALSTDPALAPLIFRDDPFFLGFNNDDSESSYSESGSDSTSSD